MTEAATQLIEEKRLEITREIDAPREEVFDCFINRERLMQWHCPVGMTVSACETDPKVGGAYRIVMTNADGQNHTVCGTYREISAPSKIVESWAWEQEDGSLGHESLVTLTFIDVGGKTKIHLVHENHLDTDAAEQHGQGWSSSFDNLESLLAK